MTNETNNAPALIDNGGDTIDATGQQPDARSQMLKAALLIATSVVGFEAKVGETAKDWGHNLFLAVKRDNVDLDSLIGDSKLAAGYATLAVTDGGKKAKQRLDVYFTNARLVAERWSQMDAQQQAAVLDGTSSIHYLAGQMRAADATARKEAAKAAKANAAPAADVSALLGAPNETTISLSDIVLYAAARYEASSHEDKVAAHEALEMLFDLVNADVLATENVEAATGETDVASEPEAIAA